MKNPHNEFLRSAAQLLLLVAGESYWPGTVGFNFKILCSAHTFVPVSSGTQMLYNTSSKDRTSSIHRLQGLAMG